MDAIYLFIWSEPMYAIQSALLIILFHNIETWDMKFSSSMSLKIQKVIENF